MDFRKLKHTFICTGIFYTQPSIPIIGNMIVTQLHNNYNVEKWVVSVRISFYENDIDNLAHDSFHFSYNMRFVRFTSTLL